MTGPEWTVTGLRAAIAGGAMTATEVCETYLDRIRASLGCYLV